MMMSTSDLLIMIGCALAAGLGMTTIGVLIEFALRKKQPAPQPEAAEAGPPSALRSRHRSHRLRHLLRSFPRLRPRRARRRLKRPRPHRLW